MNTRALPRCPCCAARRITPMPCLSVSRAFGWQRAPNPRRWVLAGAGLNEIRIAYSLTLTPIDLNQKGVSQNIHR
jgi:hypothetical protein